MREAREHKIKTSSVLIIRLVFICFVITSMSTCGFLGLGGTVKWKEEVKLSDGRIIIVQREIEFTHGGGEWPQKGWGSRPKDYRMRFVDPNGSGATIDWKSMKKAPSTYPELPLILDVVSGNLVVFTIVGIAPRCEAYNKYIYRNGDWCEEELPERFETRTSNLMLRGKDDLPKFIDLETKRKIIAKERPRKEVRQVGPTRQVCG